MSYLIVFQCVINGTSPKVILPLGQTLQLARPAVAKPNKMEVIEKHQSRLF